MSFENKPLLVGDVNDFETVRMVYLLDGEVTSGGGYVVLEGECLYVEAKLPNGLIQGWSNPSDFPVIPSNMKYAYIAYGSKTDDSNYNWSERYPLSGVPNKNFIPTIMNITISGIGTMRQSTIKFVIDDTTIQYWKLDIPVGTSAIIYELSKTAY